MSITLILIIITGLVSYQCFENRTLFEKLKHYPYNEQRTKEWHRMLTSGFVHGSWMHLGINMYVFYIFGEAVERQFAVLFGEMLGRVYFLLLYLLTIVAADIPTYLKHKDNAYFASVGASGAVSGILFVFILFYPWAQLLLFFIIPCPAIIAGVLYLVYSSWAAKNTQDGIDHDAHFYGAVFGLLGAIALDSDILRIFLDQFQAGLPF